MATQEIRPPAGVAAEVLDYLWSHPNAADTMEGIINWWLPRQRYETERRKVEQALEQLIAQGLIVESRLFDGTVLYSRGEREDVPGERQEQDKGL